MFLNRSRTVLSNSDGKPARWEWWLGAAVLVFLVYWRWRATSRFRIESDEPQHLHVVWGWMRGMLPYRDFFDNHTPLFHWLYAPVLRALGERADIVVAMRIAVLPVWAMTLGCVYGLGRALWNARAGWWAAVLTAAQGTFFYTSLEFRPDGLWALLWVAAIWAAVSGMRGESTGSRMKFFGAGLLAGMALATSIKTVLLVGSFGAAAVLAWLLLLGEKQSRVAVQWRVIGMNVALLAAGAAVVPLGWVLYFRQKGALAEAAYCLFHHNTSSLSEALAFQPRMLILPAALLSAMGLAWVFLRKEARSFERSWILFGAVIYASGLVGFWSGLTPLTDQDWLPWMPLAMVLLAGGLGTWPALAVLAFLLVGVVRDPVDNTPAPGKYERFLANVLKLTGPDDYVMDAKGEAIYRRRPYFFVLETQTRRKLIAGDLPDDIPERLVATRTAVTRTNRLPDRAEAFVEAHYLRVGRGTSVLGQDLFSSELEPTRYEFEVGVPERYVIVGKNGPVTGELDGTPLKNARELTAGRHIFIRSSPAQPIALFWARAAEKGFSAFAARDLERGER